MKNILYVEDDAVNAFVIEKLLHAYKIKIVSSGEQALEIIEDKKFDLILMDINLGNNKMSGSLCQKRIRKMEEYKSTPIIAVTSYAWPEDKLKYTQEGFTDYIPKPIDENELLAKVKKFIGR